MNKYSIQALAALLMTAGALAACSDDTAPSADGNLATSIYTNKLSAGDDANLYLTYSGQTLIGKEARLTPAADGSATLRLYGILPGDSCTTLTGVSLTQREEGFSFSGTGTAQNVATGFRYEGTTYTDDGSMTLAISDVNVPDNVFAQAGQLTLPAYNGKEGEDVRVSYDGQNVYALLLKAPVYSRMVTKGAAEDNLIAFAWSMALETVLDNLMNSMLHDVTFLADGNITARYKSLNDTIGFQQLMATEGLPRPDESEFAASPVNLAMYYFTDPQTMYVVPNIDQIMQQVQEDQAAKKQKGTQTRSISNETTGRLAEVAHVLTTVSTRGLRLTVKENPYRQTGYYNGNDYLSLNEGDYVVYADLKDLSSLLQLCDVLRMLIPEETLGKDVFQLLEERGITLPAEVEEYMPIITSLLPDTTVAGIINALEANLNDFETLEIGFYLNK